eukprot:Skav230597  [mRNA]  locus=scaffold3317:334409:338578:- [translate_table: standard]
MAGNSNTAVGWAESISGLSQILFAAPAGMLTDTCSRSKVLNWCVLLGVVAVVVSIAGVGLDNFSIIYLSLFIFGVYGAVQNTASFALYSDSIPQGSRAKWLSRVSIVNQVGYGAGPFFSLFLKLSVLHLVLIIGFLGMIPANLFMLNLKDAQHEEAGAEASGAYCNLRCARMVPWLICILDVVSAIGAGMTVKFFPLFFKEDYGLNPGQIQLLFAVYGLSFGFFTWLCEQAAAKVGRYLMDAYDYRQTFVITAFIYLVSASMRIPLFFVVPRYELPATQEPLISRVVSKEDWS